VFDVLTKLLATLLGEKTLFFGIGIFPLSSLRIRLHALRLKWVKSKSSVFVLQLSLLFSFRVFNSSSSNSGSPVLLNSSKISS
jgi:hypothetical protein